MAVVEVGWTVRAGYIGDVKCTKQFPSIHCVDVPTETCFPSILMASEATGGNNIQSMWTLRSLEHKVSEHVEYLGHIMWRELQCPEDVPLMLVVPEVWHERSDVMLSLFRVVLESGFTSALYCCRPSVAWTLASGKSSAVVLDVGHSHATTTAVLDGYALRGSITSSSLGGCAVTQRLIELLDREQLRTLEEVKRYRLPCVTEWALNDIANNIKCMACFVQAGHFPFSCKEESLVFRAPDGSSVRVSTAARTEPYELLFSSASGTACSVVDLLVSCKRRLDPEWQQQAIPHVICGGTSQAPGFCKRLLKEVRQRDSSYFRYERDGVFCLTSAVDGAWAGASLAAESSSFAPLWVTRDDLEEEGDSVFYLMTGRGFSAVVAAKNRQHYLQLLREKAREAALQSAVTGVEKMTFNLSSRIRSHEASLDLPENWVKTSIARLQNSLGGVVSKEKLFCGDLFLCALIHPSFVRLRSARCSVAMPIELTLTGSSTFRLLKDVAAVHDIVGVLQTEEIVNIPRRLHLEDLLLYDKTMFAGHSQCPPEEVCLAAATALCGAIVLSEGMQSATVLLDQLRG